MHKTVSDRPNLISTVIISPNSQYTTDTVETNLQDAYPKYDIYSQKDTQKNHRQKFKGCINLYEYDSCHDLCCFNGSHNERYDDVCKRKNQRHRYNAGNWKPRKVQ